MSRRNRHNLTATEAVNLEVWNWWTTLSDVFMKPEEMGYDEGETPAEVGMFEVLVDRGLDVADIDLEQVPGWVEQMKQAEAGLRFRRQQLEALVAVRTCASCDEPLVGRADRTYCSTRCRTRASRARSTSSRD